MFGIGPLEFVMILAVALLVFGPKRVPELARNLGRALAEFRRASNDLRQSLSLDELQRDLRRDLSGQPTIHRPQDRPAQAGADVPRTDKTATAAGDPDTSPVPHSGELPLGNDHKHREQNEDAEVSASESGRTTDKPRTTLTTPADSELGNIPVSGTQPTDAKRG